MNLAVDVGYFLLYGVCAGWMAWVLPVAIIVIHHIDTKWDPNRAYEFKAKWFVRGILIGLPTWGALFFIGLLLTQGGLASP